MRSEMFTIFALGLAASGVNAAAPTFSCFPIPDEGQTNPLGEGMEDVVEAECCEALIDDSDILAERIVVWDPVNCNHGPGETAITEAPLCRAHDTDGCRFCRESCDDFEGLCILCDDILSGFTTGSPTPSPSEFGGDMTDAPFGIFPETPAPTTAAPEAAPTTDLASETPSPAAGAGGDGIGGDDETGDCDCIENMSQTEIEVLETRGKTMVCDPTCSDGSDPESPSSRVPQQAPSGVCVCWRLDYHLEKEQRTKSTNTKRDEGVTHSLPLTPFVSAPHVPDPQSLKVVPLLRAALLAPSPPLFLPLPSRSASASRPSFSLIFPWPSRSGHGTGASGTVAEPEPGAGY